MDTTNSLAITWVEIGSLFENPSNPRHNDDAVPHVAASIKKFGWQQPIVAKKNGEVIAGHTRLKAARKLGIDTVPVVYFSGSELDALAYGIADNKSHEFATWDDGALVKILETLKKEDALDATGFTNDDIDNLLRELGQGNVNEVDDPGPGEPPVNPVSRPGDLWLLGDHRLLCGDSTKAESYQKILGAEKVVLISTDPPYCVDYTGKNRPVHDGKASGKDWSHVYREIDITDLGEFIDQVFTAALPYLADHAPVYCWHAHVQQPVIAAAFIKHGLLLHQIIVWVKPTAVFGHSYYHWQHEPCAFGWKKGSKPEHGQQILTSVWECDWEGKARVVGNEHPCLHPDALVLTESGYRPIQSIRVGDRVYSADGAFHPVSDVSSHPYQSPNLIRIVAKGNNAATLASDNHPFLIWRPERKGTRILGGSAEWLRADEIQIGDYTMTPVLAEQSADPFPEKDDEYWFLFGLYLAQGSLQMAGHGNNRYPSFSLHLKRQDLIRRVFNHWTSVSEYDSNEYGKQSQGVTVMAFDACAGAEFERFGGRLSHGKRIAPEVFALPRSKRLAVLQGWLNGDGCKVHNRDYWQGKTVSPDLAAQLALLAESVGYRACAFRFDPPAVLGGIGDRKFKTQRAEYHLYFYELNKEDKRTTNIEYEGTRYMLRYVKCIERVPYRGEVWNLSVEGSPTFQTAVGMSHNTQKPLRLFEIPLEQHTKPGDIILEPFSGSGSQLVASEKLNRKCRAIEISPHFVDVAVQRWQVATKKIATLEGDGRSFDAIKSDRGL